MKDTLTKKNFTSRNTLLRMWKRYSYLVEKDIIDEANSLIIEIEELLPFKSKEEHEKWITLGNSNCWENWEEFTLELINSAELPKDVETLLESYSRVALDVCEDSNFYDLFNTFAKLTSRYVDRIQNWEQWWKELSTNIDDLKFFLETYKDIYGKEFKEEDIRNYYGFEICCHPMFYKNDVDGKSCLLECIFERYVQGLDEDEQLWFFQRLIKELI